MCFKIDFYKRQPCFSDQKGREQNHFFPPDGTITSAERGNPAVRHPRYTSDEVPNLSALVHPSKKHIGQKRPGGS